MTATAKSHGVQFGQRWLVTTVAVLVAAWIVPGVNYDSFGGLVAASLLLGVLNAFVRPVIVAFSIPLLFGTLGLFFLFINAFLLYAVGLIVRSFHVTGFWAALWGGLVISAVSLVVNLVVGVRKLNVEVRRRSGGRRESGKIEPPIDPGPGAGPIIDV
jgi:putative membrane protein